MKLSVVIPVFNEEKVIKQVINKWLKALKQINFKIIIINDGSNDKSKRIIKSILTNKIILLNKKNSGHSFNFGPFNSKHISVGEIIKLFKILENLLLLLKFHQTINGL